MNDKLKELQRLGIYRPNRKGPMRLAMDDLDVGDSFMVTNEMCSNESTLRTKVFTTGRDTGKKFSVHKSETGCFHVIRVK